MAHDPPAPPDLDVKWSLDGLRCIWRPFRRRRRDSDDDGNPALRAVVELARRIADRRRRAAWIELRLGRDRLLVRWKRRGRVVDERSWALRSVGRVDAVGSDPEARLIVAQLAGTRPLRLPAQTLSARAARWLAARIQASGRAARERDGLGLAQVPASLQALRGRHGGR